MPKVAGSADDSKPCSHSEGCTACGLWDRDEYGRLMCCCPPERYAQFHGDVFEADDVVVAVTRQDAIESGELIDVSAEAAEAGFRRPVAMTRAAWLDAVKWDDDDSRRQVYQEEAGRLWDVVWMAWRAAVHAQNEAGDTAVFALYRVPRGGKGVSPRLVELKAVCGPGDAGEAVITIMLTSES